MTAFRHGHATHPDWRMATELALAQIEGQAASDGRPTARSSLGVVYATPAFAPNFSEIATLLRTRTGVVDWVGTVGQAIVATGAEYADEPAVVVMLCDLPPGSVRVFSGREPPPAAGRPSGETAAVALVHADPATPDLVELVAEMAERTSSRQLFGGIGSGVEQVPQQANGTVYGGLSGALFSTDVPLLTRVTQGCSPLGPPHVISECSAHYLQRLDDQPALDTMLADLGVEASLRASTDGEELLRALPARRIRHGLLVGLAPAAQARASEDGHDAAPVRGFGDWTVRNVLGIDPRHRVVAIGDTPSPGDRLVFCTRDAQTARQDLVRVCTELREEIETSSLTVRGGIYVSCTARGAHLFGDPAAEVRLIASQLGEFPLVGFHANGEIAGDRIYGHTGVLTLFV